MKFKSVLIGVPNNNLQIQIKNEILKVFPNKNNILIIGSKHIYSTTNKAEIISFINFTEGFPKFVISTYHSCHLLVDKSISFDFKIGDEAHHLVSIEKTENKNFCLFHDIKSAKTLFMTAT